jgi:general secretion pathway protein G
MLLRKDLKRRRAGFTLMEMLIVVAIIVALAGVGGFFLMGALSGSQKDIARSNLKTLTDACNAYKARNYDYPNTLDELTVKDKNGVKYLELDAIKDPWKKNYQYDKNGTKNGGERPDIWTTSPAPENEMIGNWPGGK